MQVLFIHLDGLDDCPEWQLGGEREAMVDNGLTAQPGHVEG